MKKLKKNRIASFIIVSLIYLLAVAVGVAVYFSLDFDWRISLLISDVAATVAVFVFSLIFNNASVYDPYWSVQPPVIITAFAMGGFTVFAVLFMIAIFFWAIRLTANWAYTFHGLEYQDWRYTMLKKNTGAFYPAVNLLGIHLVPTLVVYGCCLPAVYAIREGLSPNFLSVAFLCLSLAAACLQGVADIQMHSFRRSPSGNFIRTGLWKHSRHPNYLGEILMWWGVALSVVAAAPSQFYLCIGAVANTLLFVFISIPLADKRQSRKEGFSEYKSQTRMLLPIKK